LAKSEDNKEEEDMLLLLLLLFFFFFFLIVLLDYSIAAAAKRKLFKSEARTNTKNVYSCFVCSLCERETNLYFLLWRRSSAKENPQKEQSFSWQKS